MVDLQCYFLVNSEGIPLYKKKNYVHVCFVLFSDLAVSYF